MQMIKCWPNDIDLSIADEIKQEIVMMIIEPFKREEEAKTFWQCYGNTLFIVGPEDTKEALSKQPEQLQQQFQFALSYPEFIEQISMGYLLSLTIMSDEGTGSYILYAPGCPLIQLIGEA